MGHLHLFRAPVAGGRVPAMTFPLGLGGGRTVLGLALGLGLRTRRLGLGRGANLVGLLRGRTEQPVPEPLERGLLALDLGREEGRGGDGGAEGADLLGRELFPALHPVEVAMENSRLHLLDGGGHWLGLLRFRLLRASHDFDFASSRL